MGLIGFWVGLLLLLGAQGAAAAGASGCTYCALCPPGVSACGGPGFPSSDCTALGCSAFSYGGECNSDGMLAAARSADPNFELCPATEAGQCSDGVNNDAWLDDLTDRADPDCHVAAPAVTLYGLGALFSLLVGFGVTRLRKR